ncbi:HD-GYP domain-containing protein [Catenovulum sediminis]|uniref:HD domain-containing phosphohydrolase n=1 Tax=Catenovulum sediminis TaxID=1740262 RepID=A0ABV1RJN4_9ALTE
MTKNLESSDLHQHYATHLGNVTKDNQVIATGDIRNTAGVLVAAKNTRINQQIAEKIARHKLLIPLEQQIALEKTCKVEQELFALPSHPEVKVLIENGVGVEQFQNHGKALKYYPLLLQKLTVLKASYPEIYKKAVMGAYVALLISLERNLDVKTSSNIFIATLVRDIGLLHIEPKIVMGTGVLSAQDWLMLQGHVSIGYHYVRLENNIPNVIPRAIFEHHERCDGFGYPKQKFEHQLSLEGQVVAFADSFIGMFYKYIFALKYPFKALLPIMQFNAGAHGIENTDACIRLFGKLVKSYKRIHSNQELAVLSAKIPLRHKHINEWFVQAEILNAGLSSVYSGAAIVRSTERISWLRRLLTRSGIDDNRFVNWLKEVDFQSISDKEVEEIEQYALMLNEMSWHLNELRKVFSLIITHLQGPEEQVSEYKDIYRILKAMMGHFKADLL